jgi:UDP-N-acetylmuramoyl-tripeptide--D-alanyl-D-alanine ligase
LNLEKIAKLIKADTFATAPDLLKEEARAFSLDSRTIEAGDVFFAFSQPDYFNNGFNGDFEDAHRFVGAAMTRGAIAAVVRVDKLAEHQYLSQFRERLLIVEDCIAALQRLAAGIYRENAIPIVGITGSAGKTTAKELTAGVLQSSGKRILANIKNYNNGIGHPLTVLRLLYEGRFDAGVLEMGMSSPMHEIEKLCRITPPEVAIVLNVLPVHIEHLGTIERIRQAKAEIVENMSENGTAVLNADDWRVASMREIARGKEVLTFGIDNPADVRAAQIEAVRFGETRFRLETPSGAAFVRLRLAGKHNVSNALAAACAGICFGMSAQEIAAGLEKVAPLPMRGEVLQLAENIEVINDSYNSNPAALLSMIETLCENGKHAKRRIVVAGEMLELGAEAEKMHFETGRQIAALGIDALFGVRGLAKNLVDGARAGGLKIVEFYEDSNAMANQIIDLIKAGDLILVKGSRGVQTEKIVERLLEKFSKID